MALPCTSGERLRIEMHSERGMSPTAMPVRSADVRCRLNVTNCKTVYGGAAEAPIGSTRCAGCDYKLEFCVVLRGVCAVISACRAKGVRPVQ